MNLIDFTKNGGYRLKQFTLRKMQEATFQILEAFVTFCNVPDVGNYIISGCRIEGPNITSGYMYIDGELCKFTQSEGTPGTKIKKNVVIQSLGFKNGNNENVFRFVNAQVDETGAALSSFTRVSPVFDANYVHTDSNFTAALLAKLNGIAAGAEVNVQANFTQNDNTADDYIKNKPVGNLLTYLWKGTYIHGDLLSGIQLITISFPSVGTSNYTVLTQVTGLGVWQRDAKVNCVVRSDTKTPTSFQISLCDYTNESVQDLRVDLVIIPN